MCVGSVKMDTKYIPHGTTDTRNLVKTTLVKTTGVAVHHFPQGVDWGDGNTVYVANGVDAKKALVSIGKAIESGLGEG